MRAADAWEKLKEGNRKYLHADVSRANISRKIRLKTYENGQSPYAVIVACSDSRVIPECIFSADIGDLFVIRVAGNVIGDHQLGSIEYAMEHLGCRLAVILGHTGCGAVGAAVAGGAGGFVRSITDEIRQAIGEETDDYRAGCLNVERSVNRVRESLDLFRDEDKDRDRDEDGDGGFQALGAMYHTDTGEVQFLP